MCRPTCDLTEFGGTWRWSNAGLGASIRFLVWVDRRGPAPASGFDTGVAADAALDLGLAF
jgi:hypothetical protein